MDKEKKRIALQILLFFLTFITATIAGYEWIYGRSVWLSGLSWSDFISGLPYSVSFLLILSVHEFGHYFTARYHQIKTSLPYYIPLPPFSLFFGTLGALIRIRQRIPTTTINFDVGIAGPLAGFVAAIGILVYGFLALPPPEYIFTIHPEYQQFGLDYAKFVYTPEFLKGGADIILGDNILFKFLSQTLADPSRMPNSHEMMHYPFLFAGYLSLVFTALNLLPIGQLDGGHVVYGLFGAKGHRWIATTFFLTFIFFAGIGVVRPGEGGDDIIWTIPLYLGFLFFTCRGLRYDTQTTVIISLVIFLLQYLLVMLFPSLNGFHGWLLFAFLLGRFVGVRHPGAEVEEPLTLGRKILGWLALVILVLCFTPTPIEIISYASTP
jgi:membrane-associated protease RseP (regulator of RpoE activity)